MEFTQITIQGACCAMTFRENTLAVLNYEPYE